MRKDNKPCNNCFETSVLLEAYCLRLNSTTANVDSVLLTFLTSDTEKKNILTYKFQCLPFENAFLKCGYYYLQMLIWDQYHILLLSTLLSTILYAKHAHHYQHTQIRNMVLPLLRLLVPQSLSQQFAPGIFLNFFTGQYQEDNKFYSKPWW